MTSSARSPAPTPAAQGYRMPAEWLPHQATWLSWPHNRDTWPGVLAAAERALAAAVAALSGGELVHINVLDERHERHVAGLLAGKADPQRLRLHRQPTNDAWCRDHGAIFVTRQGGEAPLLALDFGYNAWGGKYPPFDLDDAMPRHMAARLGVPCRTVDMILEGGSIEVNGAGTLLTTEQCLLNPNRNPRLSRADIEQRLRENLGIDQVLWLGEGIVGDDTDGHIDDLTRFVAEDVVVTVLEPDPADVNYAALRDNRERLAGMRLADGRPLRVIDLPMPEALERDGERLPASYANFYIGNRVVLLPVFGCPQDAVAAATLAGCFPGRQVVPVDCRDVVVGLGTLHCLTQQVPA
ncbi:MAG: agmatine deiminase family protein [Gammaproteobacteria bacterium]|nr:agmatine deiminase family protein [Gammaproteobacteria bacterium]